MMRKRVPISDNFREKLNNSAKSLNDFQKVNKISLKKCPNYCKTKLFEVNFYI